MPGVNFHHFSAYVLRDIDIHKGWIDEKADRDAPSMYPLDRFGKTFFLVNEVQAAFRGEFLTLLWNKCDHIRCKAKRDADHLVGRGHFEVKFHCHSLPQ